MAKSTATITPINPVDSKESVYKDIFTNPLDMQPDQFQEILYTRGKNHQYLIEYLREAMILGTDYGEIPARSGKGKMMLFRPGADRITALMNLQPRFPTLPIYEQRILEGYEITSVFIRCELYMGDHLLSVGVSARTLKECNNSPNLMVKKACKSAHVDALYRLLAIGSVFIDEEFANDEAPTEQLAVEKITSDQIRQIKALLYSNRVHSGRFYSWLNKFCSANSFGEVDDVEEIPSALFAKVCDKIRNDFVDTAGAPVNSTPSDQE